MKSISKKKLHHLIKTFMLEHRALFDKASQEQILRFGNFNSSRIDWEKLDRKPVELLIGWVNAHRKLIDFGAVGPHFIEFCGTHRIRNAVDSIETEIIKKSHYEINEKGQISYSPILWRHYYISQATLTGTGADRYVLIVAYKSRDKRFMLDARNENPR